jgi:hypothetical protein
MKIIASLGIATPAPRRIAAAVIRWGPDAPSDVLRQRARCTRCGHLGATIQTPSWAGGAIGFVPFPSDVVL